MLFKKQNSPACLNEAVDFVMFLFLEEIETVVFNLSQFL